MLYIFESKFNSQDQSYKMLQIFFSTKVVLRINNNLMIFSTSSFVSRISEFYLSHNTHSIYENKFVKLIIFSIALTIIAFSGNSKFVKILQISHLYEVLNTFEKHSIHIAKLFNSLSLVKKLR